jgi:hypothetical protein
MPATTRSRKRSDSVTRTLDYWDNLAPLLVDAPHRHLESPSSSPNFGEKLWDDVVTPDFDVGPEESMWVVEAVCSGGLAAPRSHHRRGSGVADDDEGRGHDGG